MYFSSKYRLVDLYIKNSLSKSIQIKNNMDVNEPTYTNLYKHLFLFIFSVKSYYIYH